MEESALFGEAGRDGGGLVLVVWVASRGSLKLHRPVALYNPYIIGDSLA